MINIIRLANALKKLQIADQLKKILSFHVTTTSTVTVSPKIITERELLSSLPLDTCPDLFRQQTQSHNIELGARELLYKRDSEGIAIERDPQNNPTSQQKHFSHLDSCKYTNSSEAETSAHLTAWDKNRVVISSGNCSEREVKGISEKFNTKMSSSETTANFEQKHDSQNCDKLKMKISSSLSSTASSSAKSFPAMASCSDDGKKTESNLTDIIKFLELVGSLKHLKRTGWVMRNVKDCESVSGHMYRMSMITFLLDEKLGLNRTKCMEMALVHDLAECVVGDITPFCGVSKEDKKQREISAMEDICKLIEPHGKRMLELFLEYEEGESPESKFVKDLDRLDMLLQAFEYEKRDNCVLQLQEFFNSVDGKIDHPFVKQISEEIKSQRANLAAEESAVENGVDVSQKNGYSNGFHDHSNGDVNNINEKKVSTS